MIIEEYKKLFGEPIPLMEIMGNELFETQFHGNPDEVYLYCIKTGQSWQKVLKANPKYERDLLY